VKGALRAVAGVFERLAAPIKFLAGIIKREASTAPHVCGMATAAPSSKLYDTLAEAVSATNARNARSLHRTRSRWVAVAADNGGFTVRWVGRPRSRPRIT